LAEEEGHVEERRVVITIGAVSKALLWLVYVWVVVNLVLLFTAFVLQLFGANPEAGFTDWVYGSVSRSMAPFRGMFEPIVLSDKSVLNTSLLFAMLIYSIVALFLSAAIHWVTEWLMRQRRRVAATPTAEQLLTAAPAQPGQAGPVGGYTPLG